LYKFLEPNRHFILKIGFGICDAYISPKWIANIESLLYIDSIGMAVDMTAWGV
jgi:hypothetical protein